MNEPLSPPQQKFIEEMVWRSDGQLTAEQVIERAKTEHGSLQRAFDLYKMFRPEGMARPDAMAKPRPGETAMVYPLGRDDGICIRLHDGHLVDEFQSHCLDFIDRTGAYVKKPDDLKIFKNPKGDGVAAEFFTAEDAIANNPTLYREFLLENPGPQDPNFQTYIVREGFIVDVVQTGRQMLHIEAPTRHRDTDIAFITPINVTY